MSAAKRGQCPVCRYSLRLRKDGTVETHRNYSDGVPCKGSGGPPRPFDPNECGACLDHRFATPGLAEACSSQAIESSKTAAALMWDYLVAYHESGHKDAA